MNALAITIIITRRINRRISRRRSIRKAGEARRSSILEPEDT